MKTQTNQGESILQMQRSHFRSVFTICFRPCVTQCQWSGGGQWAGCQDRSGKWSGPAWASSTPWSSRCRPSSPRTWRTTWPGSGTGWCWPWSAWSRWRWTPWWTTSPPTSSPSAPSSSGAWLPVQTMAPALSSLRFITRRSILGSVCPIKKEA